jgi:hypothetical protein
MHMPRFVRILLVKVHKRSATHARTADVRESGRMSISSAFGAGRRSWRKFWLIRSAMVGATTLAAVVLVPQAAHASNDYPSIVKCTQQGILIAQANNSLVSAELAYPKPNLDGMLRARGGTPEGPWEHYQWCLLSSGLYALYSDANRLWVSAEAAYPRDSFFYGMLRARATRIGPWEQFNPACNLDLPNGEFRIWSNATLLWVTDQIDYSDGYHGMLRADGAPAQWEVMDWWSPDYPGTTDSNSLCSFR